MGHFVSDNVGTYYTIAPTQYYCAILCVLYTVYPRLAHQKHCDNRFFVSIVVSPTIPQQFLFLQHYSKSIVLNIPETVLT